MKVVCFGLVLTAVAADTVCKWVNLEATHGMSQCLRSEDAVCAVLAKAECDANAACIHNEDNGPGCRTKAADAYITAFMASDCVGINEADCKAKTDTCISVSASSCLLSEDYVESKCLSEKTEEDCAGVAAVADSPCKWVDDYSHWHRWCFTSQRFICNALSKEDCESNVDCFYEEPDFPDPTQPHCVAMADKTAWDLDLADPSCFVDSKDDCVAVAGCTWSEIMEVCYTNAYMLTNHYKCHVLNTQDTCEVPATSTAASTTPHSTTSTTPLSTISTTVAEVLTTAAADAPCKWADDPWQPGEEYSSCQPFQVAVCSLLAKDACESNTDCFVEDGDWNVGTLEDDDDWCWTTASWADYSTQKGSVCVDQEDETLCEGFAGCTWDEVWESCYTNSYAVSFSAKEDTRCYLKTKNTCEEVSTTPASTVASEESTEATGPCQWAAPLATTEVWDHQCFTLQGAICSAFAEDACEKNTGCFLLEGLENEPWICLSMVGRTAFVTDAEDPVCFADEDDCKALAECTWVEEHEACYTNAYVLTDDLKCDVLSTKDTCEAQAATTSTSESDETSNAVNVMALSTILLTAGLIL